ncbi:protease pro-enzyme activation domain-containing protein [Streptacidiphilus griseoplanus]|uniref:protease pro-enzyme activation domain-containing protein n=1 Tax=Peterkaempfera griseoplana TaxID=66896 RepID=UPI0006E32E33|nr:protease pro-enzyme activation domain-containing protein [Peterkaempfera griseoplana]
MKSRHLAAAAAAALLPLSIAALGTTPAYASASPSASASRFSLPQTLSPAVARSHAQGEVADTQRISVAVSLKLRNTAELDRFVTAVSTPGSAEYGHYLTPAQFAARFAPTASDVDQVRSYLRSQGLTVTGVSANRQVVDASGPATKVEAAFGTRERTYVDPAAGNRRFFANDRPATLPSDLAQVVQGVSGLDDHTVRHATAAPHATPSGYGPSQYDAAYRFNQLGTDGTGQTVALWEFDGYKSSNLTAYNTQYGLSGPAATTVSVDGANYDSSPGDGQGEVELDSEIVRGVAPKATQLVYEAPNSDQGEIDMAAKIVSDNRAQVVSISWGSCEPDTTPSSMTAVNNSFIQAAAQGISIFSASGDDGSRDCTRSTSGSGVKAVDFPASSPYNTGVGGTNLSLSGGAYGSEKAWSTSGGGVSTQFAKPSWQTGSATKRTVPDVASDADPNTGFAIYTAGGWYQYGGTSAAAPLWSGYTALYNQKATAAGKSRLGQANPALYQVATGSGYSAAFHDVTSGSNQDYSTTTGYDQVTGWGSPIGDGLATALLGGTSGGNTVTVTNPGNQSTAVGTAASLQIKASDSASGQTLTYSASGLPAGLSINSSTGLISGTPSTAGTSTVTVTVKDGTGALGTATFTWTVGSGGGTGCTAAQLIGNGGFETGSASPWTASSGVVDNSTGEAAHSGSWKAWMDGYGTTHTDTVSQTVTVPAGCKATLTFWLHIDTSETTTSSAYDKLTVQAGSTTLASFSNLNKNTGYAQKTYDLSSFAGQTVTLKFTGAEDSSLQTSFVLDDVALNVS